MDRREMAFRASQVARIARQRAAFSLRRPQWRREMLAALLVADDRLPSVRDALDARRWSEAQRRLRGVLLSRPSRFVLDPLRRDEIVTAIASHSPATDRADRILAGEYDLLGYEGLRCAHADGAVDWHRDPVSGGSAPCGYWSSIPYLDPRCGDHKVIWELNRHQHWLVLGRAAWVTGDRRYRDEIIAQLRSWLAANPPLAGINWASMLEVALRAISWVWGLHFLLALDDDERDDWLVDLLLGLDRQLEHVCGNLSTYFSPNTHLTGEALGLYLAGCALPELKHARRWSAVGRSVLLDEIDRQIFADGGHAERSMHYHRYTLDFYLLACAVARRVSDPAAAAFSRAVERLAVFARQMADERGTLPRFGDDDAGMLLPMCGRDPADASDSLWMAAQLLDRPDLAVGARPEESIWMGLSGAEGAEGAPRTPTSSLLAETGYAVSRGPRHHVVIDAGPHGFLSGGHSHADALSMVATFDGLPFLIDTGTAGYTMDPAIRDRFRSSRMHNTLTLDDRSQSEPAGPFAWRRTATGSAIRWVANPAFDAFDGTHDGYLPSSHRRFIFVLPRGIVVVADAVVDEAPHHAAVHWHIDASWRAEKFGQVFRFDRGGGRVRWLAHLSGESQVRIGSEDGLGWTSPAYGRSLACAAVRLTASRSPIWIVSAFTDGGAVPALDELDRARGHVVVRLRHEGRTDWFSFAMLAGDAVKGARIATSGLATDARVAHVATDRNGRVTQVGIVDGTFVSVDGSVTVGADEPVRDAAVMCDAQGRVHVVSSGPCGDLRIRRESGFRIQRQGCLRVEETGLIPCEETGLIPSP
jgi:hypothetical protein